MLIKEIEEIKSYWKTAAIEEAATQYKNRETSLDDISAWDDWEQEQFFKGFLRGDFSVSPENR